MTPNRWDIYENHRSFKRATAALDAAWEEAKRLAPEKPGRERALLAAEHVGTVMRKYRHVGANDTEPRGILYQMIAKHFGFEI